MEEENIGKSLIYLVLHAFGFIMALIYERDGQCGGFCLSLILANFL